jgi:hypothetical protein
VFQQLDLFSLSSKYNSKKRVLLTLLGSGVKCFQASKKLEQPTLTTARAGKSSTNGNSFLINQCRVCYKNERFFYMEFMCRSGGCT